MAFKNFEIGVSYRVAELEELADFEKEVEVVPKTQPDSFTEANTGLRGCNGNLPRRQSCSTESAEMSFRFTFVSTYCAVHLHILLD